MKVRKSLGEIVNEIAEIKRMREMSAHMVAVHVSKESNHLQRSIEDFQHFDKLLKYLQEIEVEYEDEYEE
jgi:RNase H-fold protein (predicted Holliday junction resolvase)